MKSGSKLKIEVKSLGKFSIHDYANAHKDWDCMGSFRLRLVHQPVLSIGALGPVKTPAALMVVCKNCEAAYILPEFQETIELAIATQLVLSREMLSKSQIRFLRQYFDLTQEELARKIGLADRHTFSKLESERTSRVMTPETQIIMKLLFAKLLGIKDADKLYSLIEEINDYAVTEINPAELPSEKEVKQLLKAS